MMHVTKPVLDKVKFTHRILSHLAILLLVLIVCSQPVFAAKLLKKITYAKQGKFVEVSVHLDTPFTYVKHFPGSRGKIVQIQIKDKQSRMPKRRELLLPDKFAPLPLRDVIYEGNVLGGPYLVFRFNRIVEFIVKQNTNNKKMTILVKFEDKAKIESRIEKQGAESGDIERLMIDGRNALTSGRNAQAILLFSKILSLPSHEYMSKAREFLGLSRERNGQLDLAKKEYEKYLELYADKRHAKFVRQRLMTLNTRLVKPKKKLRLGKKQISQLKEKKKNVDIFGRVSQYYYRGFIYTENNVRRTQQNSLLSFFDLTRRARSTNNETRMVFSGSHELNLLDPQRTEVRVRSIYGEFQGKRNGFKLTLGRQSDNDGGVLGRFDGGLMGVRLIHKVNAYLVAGWPVDYIDHQKVQSNRPLLGGRLELDGVVPKLKLSSYAIQQNVDGVVNRAAVGGNINYFSNGKVLYSLIDYDVSYRVVNFLSMHAGWRVTNRIKLDFHFDRRRSPVIFTTNALQGLSVRTVAEQVLDENGLVVGAIGRNELNFDSYESLGSDLSLGTKLTIKKLLDLGIPIGKIRQRAINNTGRSTLITFTARYLFKKDLALNSYFTMSKFESGAFFRNLKSGIPKDTSFLPKNFNYSFSSQLIKSNFLQPRGVLLGGGRISYNENSQRAETNVSFRTSIAKKWWTDYKLRLMYTINRKDDKRSIRVSPRIKLDYRMTRKFTIDSGVGLEYNRTQFRGQDYRLIVFNSGFRYLF